MQELGDLRPARAADYIFTGSFPRIHDEHHEPSDWYLNYVETYIEKDLKEFVHVLDLDQALYNVLGLSSGFSARMPAILYRTVEPNL